MCRAVNPRGVQRAPGNEADVDVAAFSVGAVDDDGRCVLEFYHSLRQAISEQDHLEKEPGGLKSSFHAFDAHCVLPSMLLQMSLHSLSACLGLSLALLADTISQSTLL